MLGMKYVICTLVHFLFLRFWTNEKGERIFNPFLFCCNLVSVTGGSGRESRVGLRLEVSVQHEDDEDDDLLAHLDTEVSLVPGAPLRCVSATNTSLDREQIRDSGDVVFKIRLVTIFTLSELDFLPDSLSDSSP